MHCSIAVVMAVVVAALRGHPLTTLGISRSEAAHSTSLSQTGSGEKASPTNHLPKYYWKKILTVGLGPDGRRQGHTAVALDDYLIFFGGCKLNGECFNDLQILDTISVEHSGVETMQWKDPIVSLGKRTSTLPVARGGHTASLVGERMYVFGGKFPSALGRQSGYLSDVYMLSHLEPMSNWHALQSPALQWDKLERLGEEGLEPSLRGREGHSAVVYEDRYIYYFGGYTVGEEDTDKDEVWMNDLLVLDTRAVNANKAAWESIIQPIGAPPPREGHIAVVVEHKMFIFGGFADSKSYKDLYSFDLHTRGWEALNPGGNSPHERGGGAAIAIHGSSILLLGGCDFERKRKCYSDVYALDVNSLARRTDPTVAVGSDSFRWATLPIKSADSFSGREGHTVTLSKGRMFVFGGCSFERTCFNNILELAPLQNSRKACNSAEAGGMLCSGHGECLQRGVPPAQPYFDCECDDGWESVDCSKKMECPVGSEMKVTCSGHGTCTEHKMCKCDDGFSANDCSQQQDIMCPAAAAMEGSDVLQCSGHGTCPDGKCKCEAPWTGLACNILEKCQKGNNGQACSGHGECVYPGPVNVAADGSFLSVNVAAETTGILWFESPGIYNQEKETPKEKTRRLSMSFLEKPGAFAATDNEATNEAAAAPADVTSPNGPPSPNPNEVSDVSVVGRDAIRSPPPVLQMPFFYCKCLPGFAGENCGKSIADPGRFFVKVYMSGESTVDEVMLLKQFYQELLFDKLRLAMSDFASVGQDQVILLSAMTKATDLNQKERNRRKEGTALRPGQPEVPETNLLLLQAEDKARHHHGALKSLIYSYEPANWTLGALSAGDLHSDSQSSVAIGGNTSNMTEVITTGYGIVAELVVRAYGKEEVTMVQGQLDLRSDDRTFTHLMRLRGWHKGDAGITAFRLVPDGYIPPEKLEKLLNPMQKDDLGAQTALEKQKAHNSMSFNHYKSLNADVLKTHAEGTRVTTQAITKPALEEDSGEPVQIHGHRFRGGHRESMSPFSAEKSLVSTQTKSQIHTETARSCLPGCSSHGYCEKSRCYCSKGWAGVSCSEVSFELPPPGGSRLTISSRNIIDANKAYHWVVGAFMFSFAVAWASPYLVRTMRAFSKKEGDQPGTWFKRTHGQF